MLANKMKALNKFKEAFLNLKNLRTIVRNVCDEVIAINLTQQSYTYLRTSGITEHKYNNNRVIVSLTSYGERAYNVYLTIVSLMNQSCKANKIILWLAENEFDEKSIPETLKKLIKYGLEVRFYKDIKSFKKLIPTLKEYPDDTIITVDDDMIYPYTFLEVFIKEHKANPQDVLFTRGHKITLCCASENIRPYRSWKWNIREFNSPSIRLFPTGCGGILYPPKCFHSDVLNEEYFLKLTPTADDVWFKTMTVLNHIPCRQIKILQNIIAVTNAQDNALSIINNNSVNQNDKQIIAVLGKYPIISKILRSKL